LEDALHRHFEPEFLNRIDRILMFEPIDHQWLEALLKVELGKLNQRLAAQHRSLVLDESARAWLCRDHDVRFGARALGRRLRVELEPAIAECVLRDPGVGLMGATVDSDRLVVSQQAACIQ